MIISVIGVVGIIVLSLVASAQNIKRKEAVKVSKTRGVQIGSLVSDLNEKTLESISMRKEIGDLNAGNYQGLIALSAIVESIPALVIPKVNKKLSKSKLVLLRQRNEEGKLRTILDKIQDEVVELAEESCDTEECDSKCQDSE